ncbi:MAG: FkbM family methyltransferase [Deltaproteobacteria bacterium]|nr:FkbM family methyltransferase [Deltaproteobacteria bacterium]
MIAKLLLCEAARPLLRAMPVGQVRLLTRLGGGDGGDHDWDDLAHPFRAFFDRKLQAHVLADLRQWSCRWHYFAGEFWDHHNQLLMERVLRPGDCCVDVGANIGMHTIFASRCVGSAGQVFAVEPNPDVFQMLQAHLGMNRIGNVTTLNMGLDDHDGTVTLSGADIQTGTFTMRPLATVAQSHVVEVHCGDDVLPVPPGVRLLIKIDTEGYEHHVLRGMERLLARADVVLSIEVCDAWLRATGSSSAELFGWLRERGFRAWDLRYRVRRLRRVLDLRPADGGEGDFVFARDEALLSWRMG